MASRPDRKRARREAEKLVRERGESAPFLAYAKKTFSSALFDRTVAREVPAALARWRAGVRRTPRRFDLQALHRCVVQLQRANRPGWKRRKLDPSSLYRTQRRPPAPLPVVVGVDLARPGSEATVTVQAELLPDRSVRLLSSLVLAPAPFNPRRS